MEKDNSIHGMKSKDASNVRKQGHIREEERQKILLKNGIKCEILGGTIKPDIKREDNILESVKGAKKTQWFLFSHKHVNKYNKFTQSEKEIFTKWGSCYTTPSPYCEEMCETIKKDPKKWVRFFIGTDKFDLMVIKDERNGEWFEFESEYFIDKLMSRVVEIYYTGTKVVFKGGGLDVWPNKKRRRNGVILMELDRRSSKKLSLFHSPLDKIIDCVK